MRALQGLSFRPGLQSQTVFACAAGAAAHARPAATSRVSRARRRRIAATVPPANVNTGIEGEGSAGAATRDTSGQALTFAGAAARAMRQNT